MASFCMNRTMMSMRGVVKLEGTRVAVLGAAPRQFHAVGGRMSLNETDRDRENASQEIDHHKSDSLSKQKVGKGQWKHELASESEAAIKADRGDVEASQEAIDKLQKETEGFLSEKEGEGKK
ncbi:MAG: hypothetical protein M1834_005264 [Cirrosporium novae-zelandiae]|nr:MAG: hypothetical protein M1834_005264 [Cirrosporium novae-zelandiae]